MAWEWVSPVATALVGLAGITGTIWTSTQGQRLQVDILRAQAQIEAERMLLAEKRAAYARFLRLAEEITHLGLEYQDIRRVSERQGKSPASETRKARAIELQERITATRIEMASVRSEISILAGSTMARLATNIANILIDTTTGSANGDKAGNALWAIARAMNLDTDPAATQSQRAEISDIDRKFSERKKAASSPSAIPSAVDPPTGERAAARDATLDGQ